jgi:pyruvate/2-oxoglutarate dehydrogenase complex dihydrolipoamide dehydrogenase (E3) component
MNYKDIATTVFTPLELGTVGLSEEEAIAKYGEGNVESYLSKFQPLEWSLIHEYADLRCIAKVIVDTSNNEKVLGMHIGAPNAGEIIQGFGVAFRKGLYYKDLQDTIGIHPTTAEELVDINIKKSSGDSAEKRGC